MAADITPELYKKIQDAFDELRLADKAAEDLRSRIQQGSATYKEAYKYASRCGELLSEVLKQQLTEDVLPNGTLYYNIAERTLGTALYYNSQLISEACEQVQNAINQAAGVNLKAVSVPADKDLINMVVNMAAHSDDYQEVLGEPVVNVSRKVVDNNLKANAKFQNKVGLDVRVEREYDGVGLHDGRDTCTWCLDRAGSWTYDKAIANGVFERHEGCGCIIDYRTQKGDWHRSSGKDSGWEEVKREELVNNAKSIIDTAQKKAEERRRERLLTLGSSRNFQRQYDTFSAKRLEHFTLNNLYLANDVTLKPREIRQINKQITQAKELLSVTNECKAPVVIVNDRNSLAAYNPVTNTFFVSVSMADSSRIAELQNIFVCSDDERSTMVHELFHWKDAEEYRLSGKIIDDASYTSEYSIFQREKAYNQLITDGINLNNPDEIRELISEYAERKCLANDYEEVYTEFRTRKVIEDANK